MAVGSGSASGKYQGQDCPQSIDFSFPNRRLQLTSEHEVHDCNRNRLLKDLLVYPNFTTENNELQSGKNIVDTNFVQYNNMNK